MKKINIIAALLIMLAVGFGLSVFSETSNLDTYTITLTNKSGKTSLNNPTSGLNIKVVPGGQGVSGLDTGVTFKASGATGLLTDVNTTTNTITVVWSGGISDGKATVTGMLKQGNTANPNFTISKIEKDGGTDITGDLDITVNLSSSTASTTSSSSSSGSATSSTSSSGGNTTSSTSSSGGSITNTPAEPSITLKGPEEFVIKKPGANVPH